MNAILSQSLKTEPTPQPVRRRSLNGFLTSFERIASESPSLVSNLGARFEADGETVTLPRYLFIGPQGGDAPIRIGIFASVHGDEPEGAYAVARFVRLLEENPEIAAGYLLSIYPVCNPTGFEDHTLHSRSGRDLDREFWKNSTEPEVRLLQAEIVSRSFHGLISLHTDDTSKGFYGHVRAGAALAEHVLKPALSAADEFLPLDSRVTQSPVALFREPLEGELSGPPKVRPRPFEITFGASKSLSAYLKEWAFVVALQTVLLEYRQFTAYARNL